MVVLLVLILFFCAAKFDNQHIIEWLMANGCLFDKEIFSCADKFGNLDNMKWLS